MLRKLLLVFCLVCGCLQVAAQGKLSNVKVEDADGKLVESKEIRHDHYQPQMGIIIEGTEPLGEGMTLPANGVKYIPPQKIV